MSLVLHGIPIGRGYAIGKVHLLSSGLEDVPHYSVDEADIEAEVARYENAIKQTRRQIEELRKNIPEDAPAELGAFIAFHLLMLSDVSLSHDPIETIRSQKINAEWALRQQSLKLAAQFEQIEDDYLRARKQDLDQVIERIIKALRGVDISGIILNDVAENTDIVLVTTDISPADLASIKDKHIIAFTTDVGGLTSHTAILGKSLDLPSVFALNNARALIREGEWIIVDGIDGVVILEPNTLILEEYIKKANQFQKELRALRRVKKLSATTRDGVEIELLANIESASDVNQAYRNGAAGIGLFRTEFIFLNRDEMPDEEEQFALYRKLAKKAGDKPVVIRTADLGADKNPRWFRPVEGMNPAMGLTGIRISLMQPLMFRTQMRAILRASALGPVKMMWPMIASYTELKQCLSHLATCKDELIERGEEFNPDMEIGIMIEVPAAALAIGTLIKEVDFVSIGTNDLIQYTLAADRGDDAVSYLYQPTHPVIVKLLNWILKASAKAEKPAAICGEMAGDANLTRLLLGLGFTHFSVNQASLLAVKKVIVETDTAAARRGAERFLRNDDPDRAESLLSKINAYDTLSE